MLTLEKVVKTSKYTINFKRITSVDTYYLVRFNGTLIGKIDECERNNSNVIYYEIQVYNAHNDKFEYTRNNTHNTIISAKKALFEEWNKLSDEEKQPKKKQKQQTSNIKNLPSGEYQFYPTPKEVVGRMYSCVDWKKVNTVLEPSAGIGNLIENVEKTAKNVKGRYYNDIDIDCVEIDSNLQHILSGKGYKVIYDNFLEYRGYKRYDLIIMNPPFADGEKHLIKAIQLQCRGGQIVCLLNAETLRNPYSNSRKELLQLLERYGARITYLKNSFKKALRKTDVDVAMIYLNIPFVAEKSDIFEQMQQAEQVENNGGYGIPTELAIGDFLGGIITQYNVEVKSTLELIRQFRSMQPYLLNSDSLIGITVNGKEFDTNNYIKKVRLKYWTHLLVHSEFTNTLTTNLRNKYRDMVQEMADYEFNMFNINKILVRMNSELKQGLEDTLGALFKKLTSEHTYYSECAKNVHYYNGWKTNKAHKINNKVIIPCYIFDSIWNEMRIDKANELLTDIEKGFNYLNSIVEDYPEVSTALRYADEAKQTKNIKCKYFDLTFYKKGTVHIKFTNQQVVDALNIYAGRREGWLPPSYGYKSYEEMTVEEKVVIDDFQGKDEYKKVLQNREQYLFDVNKQNVMLLTAG
jgi:hypothetical protein